MKKLSLILILISLTYAEPFNFTVINNIGSRNDKYIDSLVSALDTTKTDLIIFNGIKSGLNPERFNSLKTEKYYLPAAESFYLLKSARQKFFEQFGDLNFITESDSLTIIGLNTAVYWDKKSHFSKEDLKFLSDKLVETDSTDEIILILPDSPSDIVNIDAALNILNGRKIRFIYSAGESEKLKTSFSGIDVINGISFSTDNFLFDQIKIMNDTTVISGYKLSGEKKKAEELTNPALVLNIKPPVSLYDPDSLVIWKKEMNSTLAGKPVYYNEKIITADVSGRVLCLDTLGNQIWEYFSFGNIYSTPAAADGFAAVATVQGDVETINFETGKQIQSLGFDSPVTSDLAIINYEGSKPLMIPKESSSNAALLIGTEDGTLFCYDLETLQEYWRFDTPKGPIQGKPMVFKNQIIFYGGHGIIYSIDGSSGLLIWEIKPKDKKNFPPMASEPVMNGKNVFISIPGDNLYSIEILLGAVNWALPKYNLNTSLGINDEGTILFGKSTDDQFHYLSAKLGTWVKELFPKLGDDESVTDIVEVNGNVYFGLNNGYLVRIHNRNDVTKILKLDTSPIFSINNIKDDNLLMAGRNGEILLIKPR